MRTVLHGFSGWARMNNHDNESVQVVDAAITIVGTMLVAVAWAMVQR